MQISPEAEDVGKQSENFMSYDPAVIDFSQPIRTEQRQKISRNRHLWEKNSSKITKPSENQPSDGRREIVSFMSNLSN